MTNHIYNSQHRENAVKLWEDGKNKSQIEKILNIPRKTIGRWINASSTLDKSNKIIDFDSYLDTPEKRKAYSYILAIYLCDGYINNYKTFRAPLIVLYNDSKYVNNTNSWASNLQTIFPTSSINIRKRKQSNCFMVSTYTKKIFDLFPQHGRGAKHTRKLNFADWQLKIIEEFPREFVKGCIESDGSIYIQTIGKYTYKKYTFTNKSEDIIDLFLQTLGLIGINKAKYLHLSKQQFVIQNFNPEQLAILETVISKKE